MASDLYVGPWREVPNGPVGEILEAAGEKGLRTFQRNLVDGHLTVMVAQAASGDWEGLRWHLSISHSRQEKPGRQPRPGRYPHWDEVTEARYRFVPDEARMAMFLPPKSEYVNVAVTTFHLFEVPEP